VDRADDYRRLGGAYFRPLTPWHSRVLAEYASGNRAREIALTLHCTEEAVFACLKESKRRLGARNTAQAVALAISMGDISTPTGVDARVFSMTKWQ
jgi:DNA-binding NarL/FixJ family response regulator